MLHVFEERPVPGNKYGFREGSPLNKSNGVVPSWGASKLEKSTTVVDCATIVEVGCQRAD